jgi:hypothetical protein
MQTKEIYSVKRQELPGWIIDLCTGEPNRAASSGGDVWKAGETARDISVIFCVTRSCEVYV